MKASTTGQVKSNRLTRATLQHKIENRRNKSESQQLQENLTANISTTGNERKGTRLKSNQIAEKISLPAKRKSSVNLLEPCTKVYRGSRNVHTKTNAADAETSAIPRNKNISLPPGSTGAIHNTVRTLRKTIKYTKIKTTSTSKKNSSRKLKEGLNNRNVYSKDQSNGKSPTRDKSIRSKAVSASGLKKITSTSKKTKKKQGDSISNFASISESYVPDIAIEQCMNTALHNIVTNICRVDEKTAWIGRQAFGSFMKVKYNKTKKLTVIKEFKFPEFNFYDFCFDPKNNELLYCHRSNHCVMSVSADYQVRVFKCVKPMKPTCITISPDNCVFVGLVNEYDYQKSPSRAVVKYSRNGEECLKIKSMDGGNQLFAMPHRCCINPINNNIIVAGFQTCSPKGGCEGKILIFNSSGKHLFTYKDENPDVMFMPRGLTCSTKGNILCCDENNGDIHILDASGQLINRKRKSSLGINGRPWSLSLDRDGHLMIGTSENPYGMVYVANYKE